jgi:hypothetical protein
MSHDGSAEKFRQEAEAQGLILRTPDGEEPRFVFDLKAGSVVTSSHPRIARRLLLLAEAIYAPDRGEARELARLVAKRVHADEEDGIVLWIQASKAHASDPGAYRQAEWVAFGEWIEDQFLLEDAIARMDEGVPI